MESFNLIGGARTVLHIDLKSHSFDIHQTRVHVCQNWVYYYKLHSVELKGGLDHVDTFQAFNTADGTYKISENGLYTIIVGLGSYNGNCNKDYIVTATYSPVEGTRTIEKGRYGQTESTNTFTRWFFQGTILQIETGQGEVSEANFQLTIVIH